MLLKKGYIGALGLGLKAKVYSPATTEKMLAQAVANALSLEIANEE